MKTERKTRKSNVQRISPLHGSGEMTVTGEHMTWIAGEEGRKLFQVEGHSLTGMLPDRDVHRFSGVQAVDPTSLLGCDVEGPPYAGWFHYRECRLYLSWGRDGYRLVHPYGRPTIEQHLADPGDLESVLSSSGPLVLHGPPASGKSLFAAMLAVAHADRGRRVVYLTGIPTHDIADGAHIIHEIVPPGTDPDAAREVLERWRPEVAVLDLDSPSRFAGLVRDLVMAGTAVVVVTRAPERGAARESVRLLTGNPDLWRYLSPWPIAPGPKLEISREAA